jgi:hypothetical protein
MGQQERRQQRLEQGAFAGLRRADEGKMSTCAGEIEEQRLSRLPTSDDMTLLALECAAPADLSGSESRRPCGN